MIDIPKFHSTDIVFLEISPTNFSLENFTRKISLANRHFHEIGRRISEIHLIRNEKLEIEKSIDELSRKFNIIFVSGSLGGQNFHHIASAIANIFSVPLEISPEAMAIYSTHLQKNGMEYTENLAKKVLLPRSSTLLHKKDSPHFGFWFANIICVDDSLQCTSEVLEILQRDILSGCNFFTRQIVTKVPVELFAEKIEEFARNLDFEHYIIREDDNSHKIVIHHGNISQLKAYDLAICNILQEIDGTFKVFT